jgi:predicted DNA-binding ribbon-helix-helix protein
MPRQRKSPHRPVNVSIAHDSRLFVERVQTGVRIEKRLLKVLKAFAEFHDMTLGDLLEGIVLHAFDNKTPFSPESLKRIAMLKEVYGLDLDASASHLLKEKRQATPQRGASQ